MLRNNGLSKPITWIHFETDVLNGDILDPLKTFILGRIQFIKIHPFNYLLNLDLRPKPNIENAK